MSDRPPSPTHAADPGSASRGRSRPGTRGLAGGAGGFRSPVTILLVLIVVGTVALMASGFGTPPPAADENDSNAPLGAIDGSGGGGGNTPVPATTEPGTTVTSPGTTTTPPPTTTSAQPVVPLSLSLNRSDIRPGQAARVTVRADGTAVPGALVTVRGETYRTDDDGEVVVRFDRGGKASIRVTKAADGVDYEATETTVTVRRYEVDLSVSANASRVVTGEPVAFTVRADGEPVAATVTVGGSTYRTDDNGVTVVRFEDAGGYTARATRETNATTRFAAAETDLAVDRREVALRASVRDRDVVTGEPVAVTVVRSDTGAPVAGANVSLDGTRYRTNRSGVAVLSVERARTVGLEVTAPPTPGVRFIGTDLAVTVERRQVALALSANATSVETGATVRYRVTRGDTGDPVNATVEVANATYVTGPDGTVTVTTTGYGRLSTTARKPQTAAERYVAATESVTVLAPDVVVRNVSVPPRATAGETVGVTATVANVGNEFGEATVVFRLDGGTVASREVALLPSEESRVTLNVTVPADRSPGTARFELVETDPVVGTPDGVAGTVEVLAPRFTVADLSAPGTATPGDTFEVVATVQNTGTAPGTAAVTYRLDGTALNATVVSLSPNGLARVRLNVTVPPDTTPGTYVQELATDDDADVLELTVERNGTNTTASTSAASASVSDRRIATPERVPDQHADVTPRAVRPWRRPQAGVGQTPTP